MSDYVIVPSSGEGYVELSRYKQGRMFKKHILNKGDLVHPDTGAIIKVDDSFVTKLRENFKAGVCDIVQVPLANDKNQHSEDPDRNIGEVVDLQESGGKVYAIFDARSEAAADKLGKTLLGASAMMHLDYTDTRTNQKVGPTLLHMCVTNRPYVVGLDDYEEIIAATADSLGEAVLLTEAPVTVDAIEKETDMPQTLEELLDALNAEHGIDVRALQAQVVAEDTESSALAAALSSALAAAGVVKLSNNDDEVSSADLIGAVSELATGHLKLTKTVEDLQRKAAEDEVDALITEARVYPHQRDDMVELRLTNPQMFGRLVPEQPMLRLSVEEGVTPPEDKTQAAKFAEEIARLTGPEGPAAQYVR